METLITFTPAQLVAFIGAVCGFIASIGAAVAVIVKMITKIKAPEIEQNRRIKAVLRYRLFTYFNIRLSKFSYIVHLK